MNYELALKLKNAGFPQEPDGLGRWIDKFDQSYSAFAPADPKDGHIPTLSELIEACPKRNEDGDFTLQAKEWQKEQDRRWVAVYEEYDWGGKRGWGSTPEEAVANLWLALNKKE